MSKVLQPLGGRTGPLPSGTVRVTRERPCPVCGKPDWCLVREDGTGAICKRKESGKRCGDAGWLHPLAEPHRAPLVPKRTAAPKAGTDWPAEARRAAAKLTPARRKKLAGDLRLPTAALDAVPLVGSRDDDRDGPCFTFPEVDAAGTVIGINRRYADGRKKAMPGGRRGLTVPAGWQDRPGPVFVVEGPTDAAALAVAGLAGVGRPSNNTGAARLKADSASGWSGRAGVRSPRPPTPPGTRSGGLTPRPNVARPKNLPLRPAIVVGENERKTAVGGSAPPDDPGGKTPRRQ
jgi:hypothetical protein